MPPFTLGQASDYLDSLSVTYDHYDVLQTYMSVGGVPYYLSFIQPGMSVAENIDNLFFVRNAILKNEYRNLFSSQRAYVGYKGKKRDMKYKIIDPFILFCTRFPQHTILATGKRHREAKNDRNQVFSPIE